MINENILNILYVVIGSLTIGIILIKEFKAILRMEY